MKRNAYVYLLASKSKHLYVGMTTNPLRRWLQHRTGYGSDQARRFRIYHLVLLEACGDPRVAIAREKQIKGWRRSRKVALIASANPGWADLAIAFGWHRLIDEYLKGRRET